MFVPVPQEIAAGGAPRAKRYHLIVTLASGITARYDGAMPTPRLPEHMTLRLPKGTFAAIDQIAGKGKRAEWLREAAREKLERARAEKEKRSGGGIGAG